MMYAYDANGNRYNWDELGDFYDDLEKMRDFYEMEKYDFLASYCYLTEYEYYLTYTRAYKTPVYFNTEDLEFYLLPELVKVWATDATGETFAYFLQCATDKNGMLIELEYRNE